MTSVPHLMTIRSENTESICSLVSGKAHAVILVLACGRVWRSHTVLDIHGSLLDGVHGSGLLA